VLELHAIGHFLRGENVERNLLASYAQEIMDWCVEFKVLHNALPKAETVADHFEIEFPEELEQFSYILTELSKSHNEEQRLLILAEAEGLPEEQRIHHIIAKLSGLQLEDSGTTYLTKFEDRFNPDDPLLQAAIFGLPTVDDWTGGIEKGDLIIILGLVAQGKSTLAKNIAKHNYEAGKKVLFFTLEEDDEIVAHQIDCAIAEVDFDDYYYNQSMDDRQLNEMKSRLAAARESGGEMIIKSKVDCTVDKVEEKMKTIYSMIVQYSPDLVVIDQVTNLAGSIDVKDMAKVTRRLKAIGRLTSIPCIALMQSGEEDVDKTTLFSMKYAKAAAEDADKVLFVYKKDNITYRHVKLLKNRRRKTVDVEIIVQQTGGVLEERIAPQSAWPDAIDVEAETVTTDVVRKGDITPIRPSGQGAEEWD
jgi:replicative DNA helicase